MHWTRRLGGGPPIEDLHDGGQISKNDDYEVCLEFYSVYGKIEISAIWQKFRRYRYILPNLIWS